RRGQTPIATLGPGRTGVELADGDGEPRIRVHRTPTRVELLGMDGVPLARLALEDRVARIVDAARRPVALLAREGGRITVTSPDGEALAYVAGTGDLEVAALLVTPGVDAEARAVLGCERLLASPGASTSAPAASRTP
ncbi:MAG: hypothetical protein KC464_31075, partial [Myxococcales bacterium]|nr:hypothetical protein [Myxococcales bacterium]